MIRELIRELPSGFSTHEQARPRIESACRRQPDRASFHILGHSEQGREIYGAVLGDGPRQVSLIGGNHSDEPVGPEMLRCLIPALLDAEPAADDLLRRFTFIIVPHVNPDGEAANLAWMEQWPDPLPYLSGVMREPPGRDIEFGYPDMRPENEAVAQFLQARAPMALHMDLHGMAFAEGVWMLIERHWIDRTAQFRERWMQAVREADLSLFDWDRRGDKGFGYLGPGFSTTPEGTAMRAHFVSAGDPETAEVFHDSSMEFIRSCGGDPLCIVTELPLFLLTHEATPEKSGEPTTFLRFKKRVPEVRLLLEKGDADGASRIIEQFGLKPMPLPTAIDLQLRALEFALQTVAD